VASIRWRIRKKRLIRFIFANAVSNFTKWNIVLLHKPFFSYVHLLVLRRTSHQIIIFRLYPKYRLNLSFLLAEAPFLPDFEQSLINFKSKLIIINISIRRVVRSNTGKWQWRIFQFCGFKLNNSFGFFIYIHTVQYTRTLWILQHYNALPWHGSSSSGSTSFIFWFWSLLLFCFFII
jgi:hypothetical protein